MPSVSVIAPKTLAGEWVPTPWKAVKITLIYAGLGILWIFCSGRILRCFVNDPGQLAHWEYTKGCLFVVLTAVLLGFVLDRYFRSLRSSVARIQDSEAKLQMVSDNLPDGYIFQYTHDALGQPQFTYISAGVEKVHGLTPIDVLRDAKRLLSQMDPAEMPAFAAAEAESLRNLTDFVMDLRWRGPKGEPRLLHVRSRPRKDAQGQVHWDGFAQDITHRHQAEEALQLQSAALEAAANAIIITDRAGKIEWVNSAFTTITGFSKDEAIGKNPREFKSGKHDEAFYRNLWQTISDGKVWHSELINRHKDGRLYTEEATITPVRDQAGEIRHFIAVKQDVSRRKQAELELEQSHNQLLVLSRQAAIAEFATGILHNVGNVLNSIGVASSCLAESLKKSKSTRLNQVVKLIREHEAHLGAFFTNDQKGKMVPAYLCQLADKLAAEQAQALQEIAQLEKNVEHIKAIITVQQDSAKTSTRSETLNLKDVVEEALKMHSNAFARSDIQILRQFDPIPPVMLPKHKVLQILVNLIRNAIQACDAASNSPKELRIRLGSSEDRLCCAVADTGIGISGENLSRLFTFGFTTKAGGHGFGLHGALLAARDLGACLSAQSEGPQRGATFTLELPIEQSLHPNDGSPAEREQAQESSTGAS